MRGKSILLTAAVLGVAVVLWCVSRPALLPAQPPAAPEPAASLPPDVKVGAIIFFTCEYHPFRDVRSKDMLPGKVEEVKGHWVRLSVAPSTEEEKESADFIPFDVRNRKAKDAWVNFNAVQWYAVRK